MREMTQRKHEHALVAVFQRCFEISSRLFGIAEAIDQPRLM